MGTIQVTIEQTRRMKAISDLAEAVKLCARALNVPPEVTIENCTFTGGDPAISVHTTEKVTETIIRDNVIDGSEGGIKIDA